MESLHDTVHDNGFSEMIPKVKGTWTKKITRLNENKNLAQVKTTKRPNLRLVKMFTMLVF